MNFDSESSDAGWSEPPEPASFPDAGTTEPFTTQERARYDEVGAIGSGGMGDVVVALDRRLGREVALKRVSVALQSEEAGRRLAREATITARLEHPNIVPVHDAGRGPQGRLFYTMRLIRGRSLSAAIAAAGAVEARLDLLRHYLDVCHALAFAHRHQIVHRDLKPSNIMVGDFGETHVVDWGLAATVGDSSMASSAGTPAYRSPQQQQAQDPRPPDDVYSLGAVLYELICAEPPGQSTASSSLRAQMVRTGAPAELATIAAKALAADADQRYCDAAELSGDIERFLDGRRVAAHEYTAWQLLRRLAHAWRAPLTATAVGVLAATIAVVLMFGRLNTQRDRAVDAEASARSALDKSQSALAWALDRQAVALHASGALPEAEVIAAYALTAGESPEARGVLSAAHAGARPLGVNVTQIPGCERLIPSARGYALCVERDRIRLWDTAAGELRWSRTIAAARVFPTAEGVGVLVSPATLHLLDISDGSTKLTVDRVNARRAMAVSQDGRVLAVADGHGVDVIELASGAHQTQHWPCARTVSIDSLAVVSERTAVVCGDGRLVITNYLNGDTVTTHELPFGTSLRPANALALSTDGRVAAIGGIGGEAILLKLDREASTARAVPVTDNAIAQIAFWRERVVILPEQGAAAIWDLGAGAELLRLPAAASRRVATRGESIVTAGDAIWQWELPASLAPRRFQAGSGLASAAVSPDGELIAAARGDGKLTVWHRSTGLVATEMTLSSGVIKRVDFSPDGQSLAVAMAGPEATQVLGVHDWKPRAHQAAPLPARRIGFLAGGELLAALYGTQLAVWSQDGTRSLVPSPNLLDADFTDRERGLLLADLGAVWQYTPESSLMHVLDDPVGRALAPLPDGGIAIAHARGVRLHSRHGEPRYLPSKLSDLTDLAVSPDARYVAAGSTGGGIDLWERKTGKRIATLRGHSERVSFVGFVSDGTLVSASWDGSVRLWSPQPLSASASALRRDAETAWSTHFAPDLGESPRP